MSRACPSRLAFGAEPFGLVAGTRHARNAGLWGIQFAPPGELSAWTCSRRSGRPALRPPAPAAAETERSGVPFGSVQLRVVTGGQVLEGLQPPARQDLR